MVHADTFNCDKSIMLLINTRSRTTASQKQSGNCCRMPFHESSRVFVAVVVISPATAANSQETIVDVLRMNSVGNQKSFPELNGSRVLISQIKLPMERETEEMSRPRRKIPNQPQCLPSASHRRYAAEQGCRRRQ